MCTSQYGHDGLARLLIDAGAAVDRKHRAAESRILGDD
jgi:hypothetical protein